ncbi:MAG: FMN-binding protein [Oscillospiraceae bacterium]|nr:FMN-binding protein [Oscillospiraceae bacterium]
MVKDFIKPIAVLSLICLVISCALAVTNGFTKPVILEAAAMRAEEARYAVLPQATGFEPLGVEGLPASVREAYRSENRVGYVFVIAAGGYGGEMILMCGVGADGKLVKSTTLEHSETKGLGSKVTESHFEDRFVGLSGGFDGVEAITGATISSTAYISAISDALQAYLTIEEGS